MAITADDSTYLHQAVDAISQHMVSTITSGTVQFDLSIWVDVVHVHANGMVFPFANIAWRLGLDFVDSRYESPLQILFIDSISSLVN
jgi:hypothetical protein